MSGQVIESLSNFASQWDRESVTFRDAPELEWERKNEKKLFR